MYTDSLIKGKNFTAKRTFTGKIDDFLDGVHLDIIKNKMKTISLKSSAYLFRDGDEANELYYIRSGLVKIKKITEDGKQLLMSILGEGHLLGEFSGFGQNTHNYNAIVIQDVELGVIDIEQLEDIIKQDGIIAIGLMNWLSFNKQKEQWKLHDLLLNGKAGALASTLIRMSNTYGTHSEERITLDIKLTNTDIAEFIGTTRESVNRFLNEWKDKGIIDVVKGKIVIFRLDKLRCMSNSPGSRTCPIEIFRI